MATAGSKVAGTAYTWHGAPDGGACFPSANGGWTYVSNSEKGSGAGGAGSITFSSTGSIVGAQCLVGRRHGFPVR